MAKKPKAPPVLAPATGKRVCIIGAGITGLALAIRLQASGLAVTCCEARAAPGGLLTGGPAAKGFTFGLVPAMIDDIGGLEDLFQLGGTDSAPITAIPITPQHRFSWPDGTHFTLSGDPAALRGEIVGFAPEDIAGFEDLLALAETKHDVVKERGVVNERVGGWKGLLHRLPRLMHPHAWRSAYGLVAAHISSEHLCQALSVMPVLTGGDPQRMAGLALPGLGQMLSHGAYWPEGGFTRLAESLVALFTTLGGSYRGGDPIRAIHTLGNRAYEVESATGWREQFDAVVHTGDAMHLYRDLLGGTGRGQAMMRHLAGRRYAPSLFVVHFALQGTWPGIPHHSVLFGPRYRSWLNDVFDHGVLPRDGLISLHHPSLTDPTLAPPNKSVFTAVMPVAHRGKLAIDWPQLAPMLEGRVLDEIGRRLIPDIHDRIIAKFTMTPRDFALDFNSWHGSLFGPEVGRIPRPWDPLGSRDRVFGNLYLGAVGLAGTGIGAALDQAKALANSIIHDVKS